MEPNHDPRSSPRTRRTERIGQSRSNVDQSRSELAKSVRLVSAGSESRSGNSSTVGSSTRSYGTGEPDGYHSRSEVPKSSFSTDTQLLQPFGTSATDGIGMEVACISDISLDESPDRNDPSVGKYMETLRAELQLDHIMASFKKTALYLRIAVNASADRVEPLIKIQNGLFEVLKVCDSTAILLQSLKNGANNILEKLRIAYLYILDGFPDFAKTDIETIARDIHTMKEKGKSTSNAVASARKKINEAEISAKKDWQTRPRDAKSKQKKHHMAARPATDTALLRHQLIIRLLELANRTLDTALSSVSKTERVVEQWYFECKQIIQPTMAKNFKAAGTLPEHKRKDFWNPLQFKQEAISYLCRWRALQNYCEDTRGRIRQTRGLVDSYYTENLNPRDAIEKAWTLTKELESADATILGLLRDYDGRNGETSAETPTPQKEQRRYPHFPYSPPSNTSDSSETATDQSDDEGRTKTQPKSKQNTRNDVHGDIGGRGKTSSTPKKKKPSVLSSRQKQPHKNPTKKTSPKKQGKSKVGQCKTLSRPEAVRSKTCTIS